MIHRHFFTCLTVALLLPSVFAENLPVAPAQPAPGVAPMDDEFASMPAELIEAAMAEENAAATSSVIAPEDGEPQSAEMEPSATDAADENMDGNEISPENSALLHRVRLQTDSLVDMLARVVDAESAAALAPDICAAVESLRQCDFSTLAEEDMEMVAAEFAQDIFLRLDAQFERLADADYYGNAALEGVIGLDIQLQQEVPAHTVPHRSTVPSAIEAPAQEAATESVLPLI